MNRSREQQLVNYCFEFALVAKEYMVGKSHEEVANWVAHNLAELGFHTRPVGSCWGVLCEAPKREVVDHKWVIVEPGRPD